MRATSFIASLAIGAAIGLGLTWLTTADGYGPDVVTAGAWKAWPKSGTDDADPYARAALARQGTVPLELADGLAFIARTDDAGRPLDGRCDIRLSGRMPQARYWTLTLADEKGRLIANPAARYGLTSAEALWSGDGSIDIALAPKARPGNWLPTGDRGRLMLTLRLYDAPVGIANRTDDPPETPKITTERCP
ncbi:DUF1214 domain-containing protein [Ancylobacter sp. 6x-1]|uniref:DUF1214 domain-containing protein n=1 Tax=Ancylobacter crimeensis TaxID=2579147 RepID=A0ABT0D8Y2_9HYPH|nr:DUF1214 domain-containing protein [Ancylobacter crimeensis]